MRVSPARSALIVAALALATDTFVYSVAIPVLPRLAAKHGLSLDGLGLLFGSYAGGLLVVLPLAGRWTDRRGPRAPLIAGLVGLIGATALFAYAGSTAGLVAARILQGVSAAITWTAGLSLVAATHPAEQRGVAMGTVLGAMTFGSLLGPPVGGVLLDRFGPRAPFAAAAALALLDAVARVWLIGPTRHEPSREALKPLLRHPTTPSMLVAVAAGAIATAFVEPLVSTSLGGHSSSTVIGGVFGAAAIGSAVAFPALGRAGERWGAVPVIGVSLLASAVSAFGLAQSTGSVAATTVTLVALSIALSGVLAPTATLVANLADSSRPPAYGAAFALYNVAYTVGLLVGPAVAGFVAERGGVPLAERGLAVLLIVVGAWLLARRR